MEISEKLQNLAKKIEQQGSAILTEEGTKNAFVMPFISQILGYDVFDPTEVIPEFTADVGIKKGEKVDYAIKNGGEIQILIECKKYGDELSVNHASQLYRYFSTTSARIAILTNGRVYKFFTDLDSKNIMDEKPFLELDLLDIDDYSIPEIAKLAKSEFNIDSVIDSAEELKYLNQIKKFISNQFQAPDEQFVKFIAGNVYDGLITQKVRDQFSSLARKAMGQFLTDQVNDRLKSAISRDGRDAAGQQPQIEIEADNAAPPDGEHRPVSDEEFDAYNVVRAIAWSIKDGDNLAQRNAQSYSAIFAHDNNRKPICRLYFNRSQKQIGIFDKSKKEVRYPIAAVSEIYKYADQLREICEFYFNSVPKEKTILLPDEAT